MVILQDLEIGEETPVCQMIANSLGVGGINRVMRVLRGA
jgi:hypothetical protein